MGLNQSNHQISLDLNKDIAQNMNIQLRSGIVANTPIASLEEIVEFDEANVMSEHQGQPEVVK